MPCQYFAICVRHRREPSAAVAVCRGASRGEAYLRASHQRFIVKLGAQPCGIIAATHGQCRQQIAAASPFVGRCRARRLTDGQWTARPGVAPGHALHIGGILSRNAGDDGRGACQRHAARGCEPPVLITTHQRVAPVHDPHLRNWQRLQSSPHGLTEKLRVRSRRISHMPLQPVPSLPDYGNHRKPQSVANHDAVSGKR